MGVTVRSDTETRITENAKTRWEGGGVSAPFEWLYDGHPEDGINDHVSLRGDLASDGVEAAALMLTLFERDACSLSIYGEGAHFATGYLRPLRANTTVYLDDDDEHNEIIYGTAAEKHAAEHDRLDELFYAPCEPDDEGAADWWHLDLVVPARKEPDGV